MHRSLASLKEASLGDVEVNRVIDPIESSQLQLREEVDETQVSRDERNEYFRHSARACGRGLGRAQRAVADPSGDPTMGAVSRTAGIMKAATSGDRE